MSRKSFTTLSVEVKVPQAPGYSQKEILNWIKGAMEQIGSPLSVLHEPDPSQARR